ncbi:MAG: Copper-sensing two-component system response regulator CpxR [Candidatus Sulfotelmatobacter sp.]|nr:Copper-sensing two-component system response regulator CpxR [Candidatus Sulfotelmatobacter sp.]
MESILVVDDDVEMCGMLAEYLQSEGLQVEMVHNGEHGLKRALSGEHSLILLDIMLPKINGIELLRRLRTESNARVLLLTARGEEVDRIIGLEVGADDYVPKPFSARELLARIRAILRRPETGPAANSRGSSIVVLGDVEMDKGTRSVRRAGSDIELTALEFNLLELLLRMAGQVVTRERVAAAIMGRQFSPFDRSIDVHVSKLRRKLGPQASGQERIKSIRSVGYIYTAQAQMEEN